MTAIKVLLVDDDDTFRTVMSAELSRHKFDVTSAANGPAALAEATRGNMDVILLDLRLPGMDGIEVLKQLQTMNKAESVIVLTGHGTIDTAIKAIRLGAHDYLEKPCPVAKVELAIRKTVQHRRLVARQRILQDGFSLSDPSLDFVGESPEFQSLCHHIARIAQTDATTLILGETGVGKDIVAKLIHSQSRRQGAPFVVVDCTALHEELLQSELFGHEKGAFTGALRQKHGLFEVANGGTVFLDEVGDTSRETQARLLRVLETGRFRRVGGTEEVAVDVRVVSATNRNIPRAIKNRRFREDLYFRLSTLTIQIPPLRDRPQDIRRLIGHFTKRFNQRFTTSCRLSEEAIETLVHYPWPGNVRELIHVLEQSILLSDGELIEPADLPQTIGFDSNVTPESLECKRLPLREVERRHVLRVLEEVGGNRAKAASILGISERNLYRLLKKYGRIGAGSD